VNRGRIRIDERVFYTKFDEAKDDDGCFKFCKLIQFKLTNRNGAFYSVAERIR
jgi:hypothetical protein